MKLIPYKENLCSKYATKMISIKINNRCNMRCSFCVDRDGRNGKIIDVDKIAEKAISHTQYKTVIVTGGEPFLDFDKVIDLLKRLRPYKERIVLNTNGSLLTSEKVLELNGLIDELQISIHHYDESKNASVFHSRISFENIKNSVQGKQFILSINSTFNKSYTEEEKPNAVNKMIELCNYLNADRLRLTELKKVDDTEFVDAKDFFPKTDDFCNRNSNDLICKGCTSYFTKNNVLVSVKRLCEYAKGKTAKSFSCCFIDTNGQLKIDVETEDTFKVIYSDGLLTNDWIFTPNGDNNG